MTKKFFSQELAVKYRDTDSMGHVSSPVYYEYIQDAYVKYMHNVLDVPYTEKLPQIMVKTSCEYVQPAKLGDELIIESSVTRFGGKSFEMAYEIYRKDGRRTLIAKGNSVHVAFDYKTDTTVPVPDLLKERVMAFQHVL